MDTITLRQLSSLDKVYLDSTPRENEFTSISVLKNERFSYQIAYICDEWFARHDMKMEIISPLKDFVKVHTVENVPTEVTATERYDDFYERYTPGLFPDVLNPVENNVVEMYYNNWHSLWITVELDGNINAGNYTIELKFSDDKLSVSKTMNVKIIDALLPSQELIFTQWFHADCIADYYNVPAWGNDHWERIEWFVKTATKNGINMILTPIFTPPLDTEIGGERTTVQLVDVYVNNGEYSFGFDNLRKWISLCKKCGMKYFEMAHLFTQWGAEFTPKIMATVDGELKRIFGWDVSSTGEEYKGFLTAFLPALCDTLEKEGVMDNTFFHISDEPRLEHLERYKELKSMVKSIIPDCKIIDALSNYEFYKEGVVDYAIPTTDNIDEFIENDTPDLWCYYCCAEKQFVSNRFMAMPSYRNRVIGLQFYKYDIKGFLHWGYNFYNSQLSKKKINPFIITDGQGIFPGGDAFSVYPGEDRCLESLRIIVFYDAIQDLSALKLLEGYIGKEAVVGLIEDEAKMQISFSEYPHNMDFLLKLRERINLEIEKYV